MDNTMSPEIGKLTEALCKAQACIEGAKEDAMNPFFKSKYADLSSVWRACKKPLSENGLAVFQTVENGGDKIYLVTTLAHISGQYMRSYMPVIVTKQDPQSFGSAITYSRRYALSAMVGVCPADDDAEGAMQPMRKPSIPVISKSQVDELEALLKGRPQLANELLDWADVDDIDQIPFTKFTGALKAIESRLKKEAQGVA